tara:strand:- start:580 stop:924 length:345 start_codon:yes stop_codon:yes gene_type:complete
MPQTADQVIEEIANVQARREAMAKLRENRHEYDRLLDLLDASFALQDLWPGVFNHGKCKTKWTRTPLKPRGRNHSIQYKETLFITNGIGETRKFASDLVPTVIPRPWNQGAKDA